MAAKRSKIKTALRGSVNNIIMESLVTGEKYGYEIIKEVEEKTDGKIKLKQPSLYSSLKRFEAKGYIESYWQESEIGGKRHYYKLTESGLNYYNHKIAKNIPDEEEEEYLEDKIQEAYEIDVDDHKDDISKYEYNVDDQIKSLLNETEEEMISEMYEEIDNNKVYSEEELNKDLEQETEKEQQVADHIFKSTPPLFTNIDYTKNAYDDIMVDKPKEDNVFDDIDMNKEIDTPTPTVKEEVKSRIITDEYGITRMYYPDEEEPKRNNQVFDNVVYRTNTIDKVYEHKKREPRYSEPELTEEEKELKSKKFFEKFDNKSEQIKREKQSYKTEEPEQDTSNYKERLNSLYTTQVDSDQFVSEEITFEEPEEPVYENHFDNIIEEGYNIKVFTEEKSKDTQKKYLQVNKAKFAFGLVLLAFMLLQITVMLVVFKNKELLFKNEYWIFQVSYVVIALVTLFYCVPVFISPNKQSTNIFKLSYSLMFGLLAFFIVVILTYAINTFMGMEMATLKYHLVTLIVPIVMASNFITGPLIYWAITQNKKLY